MIRVERSWDPVKGPIDVKTGAGRRAVPMAFVVRREARYCATSYFIAANLDWKQIST